MRAKHVHHGHCPSCGADTRAVLSYTCPKCGVFDSAKYRREHRDPVKARTMTLAEIRREYAAAGRAFGS